MKNKDKINLDKAKKKRKELKKLKTKQNMLSVNTKATKTIVERLMDIELATNKIKSNSLENKLNRVDKKISKIKNKKKQNLRNKAKIKK